MGGSSLTSKLVEPTIVASWAANDALSNQFPVFETEPHVWAAKASVLGKADTTVGRELGRFDLRYGVGRPQDGMKLARQFTGGNAVTTVPEVPQGRLVHPMKRIDKKE